jgi:hypothetical protein
LLARNSYIRIETVDIASAELTMSLLFELLASMHALVEKGGDIYTVEARQDAIWRTMIANEETRGGSSFHRPADDSQMFLILLSAWNKDSYELPESLLSLSVKAGFYRAHRKLTSWGFFDNLTLDTVAHLPDGGTQLSINLKLSTLNYYSCCSILNCL